MPSRPLAAKTPTKFRSSCDARPSSVCLITRARSLTLTDGFDRNSWNERSLSIASRSACRSALIASASFRSFASSSNERAYAIADWECCFVAMELAPDRLDLFEALVHEVALVVRVEVPPQDLLGDADGQVGGVRVDLGLGLVAGGFDVARRPGLDLFRLLLGLLADARGQPFGVGLRRGEDLAHLRLGGGELGVVFLQRRLGAGAGGLGVGDVLR